MPDPATAAQSVLTELGFALFARTEEGALRLLGKAPEWLGLLWPTMHENQVLPFTEASPFLENFLVDAEECWSKGGVERAKSGPWIEQDGIGREAQLEATALTIDGQQILLLERLGEAFEAKKSVLQRARETVIAHQRLNSEIQKKEILLHCVADEMTAALANIITSLRLIEMEDNGPRTKLLLGYATRATEEQQTLIHRVLGVFDEELRAVYSASGAAQSVAQWQDVWMRAREAAAPLFEERGVRLDSPPPAVDVSLQIDPGQLERVMINLLENALERTPPGAAVVVRAEMEADGLRMAVEDSGPVLGPDLCENVFARWDPATMAPAPALRLHFCRIVVQNAGGEIGCSHLPAGGNRFWIRLTKSEKAR